MQSVTSYSVISAMGVFQRHKYNQNMKTRLRDNSSEIQVYGR